MLAEVSMENPSPYLRRLCVNSVSTILGKVSTENRHLPAELSVNSYDPFKQRVLKDKTTYIFLSQDFVF